VDPAYRKLLIKTGICAGLAIVLLVISSIDTPGAQGLTDTLNQVVNQEFDIDKDIGRLKFVQTLDETEAVFSAEPGVLATYPADGRIVTRYGEGGANGVRIEAVGNVASIAKGTVTAVGDIGNMGYAKVTLDTGQTVAYYNVDPAVQVDDIVMPGQTIGVVLGSYLYLEMKDGDEYIDPIAFIEQKVEAVLQ
jgi:murein DD-endopeptidase MepM/ murein hydrolase activator NlpD